MVYFFLICCSSTFVEDYPFLLNDLLAFVKMNIFGSISKFSVSSIYYMPTLMTIPYCLDYCSIYKRS